MELFFQHRVFLWFSFGLSGDFRETEGEEAFNWLNRPRARKRELVGYTRAKIILETRSRRLWRIERGGGGGIVCLLVLLFLVFSGQYFCVRTDEAG